MLPRRHVQALLLLAIPWIVVVTGVFRGPSGRSGVLDIGDLGSFFARLAIAAYALEACLATLVIAALNWSRLRPGSATRVYWIFSIPSILAGILSVPAALSSHGRH
jgi:hypothetical protein